jgi:hypothetical protein
LSIAPTNLSTANEFVRKHHRHHGKVTGCKFCIAVMDSDARVRGVVIAGRPVARLLDNGSTLEVTRCCTDGVTNGCSMLYAATSRIAKAMGYQRLITYILEEELGTSLTASGWICSEQSTGGGNWSRNSRQRNDHHPLGKKQRWERKIQAL